MSYKISDKMRIEIETFLQEAIYERTFSRYHAKERVDSFIRAACDEATDEIKGRLETAESYYQRETQENVEICGLLRKAEEDYENAMHRVAQLEALVEEAIPFAREYAFANPQYTHATLGLQDPKGVRAWFHRAKEVANAGLPKDKKYTADDSATFERADAWMFTIRERTFARVICSEFPAIEYDAKPGEEIVKKEPLYFRKEGGKS